MGPLLIAGMMAGQSLMQSWQQDKAAKVGNIKAKSDAKVANILRMADNQMQAAKDSLARYQQSQSNKYKLITGGREADAQRTNILRMADESVRGSVERRIAVAEEAGAIAASAGFAGIGGGSLAMVEQQSVMRAQRAEYMQDTLRKQQESDALDTLDATQQATVLGLDDTIIQTSLNYMETQAQLQPRVDWVAAAGKAGMSFATSYGSMGGFSSKAAPTTRLEQSVAGQGIQQSAAVSTSPFGHRPAPSLRLK